MHGSVIKLDKNKASIIMVKTHQMSKATILSSLFKLFQSQIFYLLLWIFMLFIQIRGNRCEFLVSEIPTRFS